MAISFLAANGVQAASASLLGSSVEEGTLVYDDANDVLKVCDGTNWIEVGTGSGGAVPAGNDGSIQFKSGTNLAADAANLHWDYTNNRLGIGTVNPQSLLQVAGGIQLGDDAATCPGASDVKVGTLRFNTGNIQLCTTGGWGAISGGGTLSGGTSGYLGVWSGATTMGLSGTSAGQQLFWDGASNRLLLGSVTAYQTDGSVTPRVQVHGTTATASSLSLTSWLNGANNPGSLILGHSKSATIGTNVLVDSGDALGGIYFNGDGGAGFRRAAYIQANVDATPGTNNMPGRLIFATSADGSATPTERMRIDSAGNVGIGTTAPDVPLEFAATTGEKIRLWDGGAGSRLGIGLNAANFQFFTGAGGNNFSFNTGGDLQATGTNELMRIQANGNVGVGITTPTEKLFVGGNIGTLRTSSDYNVLALTNTGGVQLHLNANGNAQGNLRTVTNHPLSFSTNNIERVRIDTAGNVGIGTTAPTSGKLQVAIAPGNGTEGTSLALGTNDWGGGSAANIQFRQDMDQTNNAVAAIAAVTETGNLSGQLQFRTSASFGTGDLTSSNTRMTIQGNGTVGIGTMSPTAKLHIDGDILLAATLPRIASASYLTLQSGAGQAMTFNTGGASERMRIDAAGHVGIGTVSPALASQAGRTYLSVKGASEGGMLELIQGGADANLATVGGIQFATSNNTNVTNGNRVAAIMTRQSGTTANDRGGSLEFWTKADAGLLNKVMTIAHTGEVIIAGAVSGGSSVRTTTSNTSSGGAADSVYLNNASKYLAVQMLGSAYGAGFNDLARIVTGGAAAFQLGTDNTAPLTFMTQATERMRIDSAGNVGIGTTSPGGILDARGQVRIGNAGAAVSERLTLPAASTNMWNLDNNAGTLRIFREDYIASGYGANGSVKLAITDGGNVGIGTTAPVQKLDVSTAIRVSETATKYSDLFPGFLRLQHTAASGDWAEIDLHSGAAVDSRVWNIAARGDTGSLMVRTFNDARSSNSEIMTFLRNGNVGIGTNNPSYLLHVNGTAYATGAAGALSDIRHKKDVHVLNDGAVAIITRLKPVSFQWKDPRDDGMKGKQFGFIAQDVEKVLPEIVLTQNNDEKTKGLKPTELIPFLTKAVQELSAANDNLRSELDELRSEIDALKAAR